MSIPGRLILGTAPSAIRQAGERSRHGYQAKKQGDAWERELECTHKGYRDCGIALVTKVPVPTIPVMIGQGENRRMLRKFSERTACDYTGCVAVDPFSGRAVMMEAKHSADSKPSLPVILRGDGSGLQYHQLTELRRVRRYGGYGCVVWKNGDDRLILLPDQIETVWITATDAMSNGRRKQVSIPARRFQPFSREVIRDMGTGRDWGEVENWLLPLALWVRAKRVADATDAAGKD